MINFEAIYIMHGCGFSMDVFIRSRTINTTVLKDYNVHFSNKSTVHEIMISCFSYFVYVYCCTRVCVCVCVCVCVFMCVHVCVSVRMLMYGQLLMFGNLYNLIDTWLPWLPCLSCTCVEDIG